MTLATYNAMPPLGGDSTPRNCRASLKTRAAPACTDQANIGGSNDNHGVKPEGCDGASYILPSDLPVADSDTHAIGEERKRLARIAQELEAE